MKRSPSNVLILINSLFSSIYLHGEKTFQPNPNLRPRPSPSPFRSSLTTTKHRIVIQFRRWKISVREWHLFLSLLCHLTPNNLYSYTCLSSSRVKWGKCADFIFLPSYRRNIIYERRVSQQKHVDKRHHEMYQYHAKTMLHITIIVSIIYLAWSLSTFDTIAYWLFY